MYQLFGPNRIGDKIEFSLFLPDRNIDPSQYTRGGEPQIQEIKIIGDFQSAIGGKNWDIDSAPKMQLMAHPNGQLFQYRTVDLPDGFYQYKFHVTFENGSVRTVSDPCSKYGGNDALHENSAFVIGGLRVEAEPIVNRKPPNELVIYEMMIDDFTKEYRGEKALLDAIHEKLDYLESLGINAIEFMPWTPWSGSNFSWGYDPIHFFGVEYRYVNDSNNPLDKLCKLKLLINELHRRGIHVIMDGVFNHVNAGLGAFNGFAYKWLYQDPTDSPFIGEFGEGGFFDEFDFDNKCVQEFVRDVCFYWLDIFEVDGIRFDYTKGFFKRGETIKGIPKLIQDIKGHLAAQQKENVALILEHLTDNRYQSIDDTNRIGATNNWFDPFMFKQFEYGRNGRPDGQALRVLDSNRDYFPGKSPVIYAQNHDHSSVMHEVGGRGRWFKTQPIAIALFTTPGAVMIHNGQEFGQDEFLPGSGPDRVIPRPLKWSAHEPGSGDFVGQRLYDIYAKLIAIRKAHSALSGPGFFPSFGNHPDGYGIFEEKSLVIYHRYGFGVEGRFERFIIAINYSDYDQYADIPFSTNGTWYDLLNEETVQVSNYRLYQQRIPSNWGRIYFQAEG